MQYIKAQSNGRKDITIKININVNLEYTNKRGGNWPNTVQRERFSP
jgi:hypothetical protein